MNIYTTGQGSPVNYCTGNITATQVTGVAMGSEAAVVEGSNNITLSNSNVTGSAYMVLCSISQHWVMPKSVLPYSR
jgi:hypothetical protein